MIGRTISHYRILNEIGRGGMGVIYRAEDTRLNREVALKILPASFSADEVSVKRFQREARAASALNHPNICTVYDIGENEGVRFIALELIEGRPLSAALSSGAMPLEQLLGLGIQIADALAAAHEKGIVHRDIKPSNVFITKRGDAKLLDFGLAKEIRHPDVGEDAVTISATMTVPGQVLGTLAYMSPEQAEGKEVDARSDIFSFGALLYEMATGQRAFGGKSAAAVFSEILREEPKLAALVNPRVPEELQRVISKALKKDRSDRYQSMRELVIDLQHLKGRMFESSRMTVEAQASPLRLPWLRAKAVLVSTVAAFVLLVLFIFVLNAPSPASGPLSSEQITDSPEPKEGPLVTDGTRLYFQSQDHPVEMSVKGGPIAQLRSSISGMRMLDISPDASQMLALKPDLNDETGRGSIWSVSVLGGSPMRVGKQLARAAHWSPDAHSIVYAEMNSVYVSDSDGSNLKKIWDAPGAVDEPYFSSDSRHISVTVFEKDQEMTDELPRIWELNADGSNAHRLALDWPRGANQAGGRWTPDGKHFVFMSGREGRPDLYEVVAPRWFEFWKKPTAVRLTGGQVSILGETPSRDGKQLFVIGRLAQGAMHAYDPKQKRFVPFLGGLAVSAFAISPDKKWIAYTDFPRNYLWRSKLDGSEKLQLTNSYAGMLQWSPDWKNLVYSDWHKLYLVSAEGGAPEKLIQEGDNEVGPSWWPGGKAIAFNYFPFPGQKIKGIEVFDLATRKLSLMPGSEGFYVPSWAPDGRYMVALAQNPSRMMLYSAQTRTWKELKRFDTPWGYWVWSGDSKFLYFAMTHDQPGIYRLTIPDGKWERVATFDGLNVNPDFEPFLSLTADDQPALMSDTSVVQIYSLEWNK
jgi:eukaryotic-like serine/threonine-protein kinase